MLIYKSNAHLLATCAAVGCLATPGLAAAAPGGKEDEYGDEAVSEAADESIDLVGLELGGGKDVATLIGTIDVDLTVAGVGYFSGLPNEIAGLDLVVKGTGVSGDGGKDEITNAGTIDVRVDGTGTVFSLPPFILSNPAFSEPALVDVGAIGMAGGNGTDALVNDGTINVHSSAHGSMISVEPVTAVALGEFPLEIRSWAIGMQGSPLLNPAKDGASVNRGTMDVGATASAFVGELSFNAIGATLDTSILSQARAVGMIGERGRASKLANEGMIEVAADSSVTRFDFSASFNDLGLSTVSTTADAFAVGLIGDEEDDTLDNSGMLNTSAIATNWNVEGALTFNFFLTGDVSQTVRASSIGLSGGLGSDTLSNSGTISAAADSNLRSVGISVGVSDSTIIPELFDLIKSEVLDQETTDDSYLFTPQAKAVGMDGGSGEDHLTSSTGAEITVTSDADSFVLDIGAVSVGITGALVPLFQGKSLFDFDSEAASLAIGMRGGTGDDRLVSGGSITGTSSATASQTSISLGIPIPDLPDATGFVGTNLVGAGARADARIFGITGDSGSDYLQNGGTIDIDAITRATAVSAAIDIPSPPDPTQPVQLALTMADAGTESYAYATGMSGGTDNDTLFNFGSILPSTDARSLTIGAAFNLTGIGNGVALLGVAARGSAEATARSVGMAGGSGDDWLSNGNLVSPTAFARGTSIEAALSIGTIGNGLAVGGSAVDASALGIGRIVGLSGGSGDDYLQNLGSITGNVTAEGLAISASVVATGATNGAVVSAGLARVSGDAEANAIGMDGGLGDDRFVNHGAIDQFAHALGNSSGGAAQIALVGQGLAAGAAILDMSSSADSQAYGILDAISDEKIDEGLTAGFTKITNDGVITTEAIAESLTFGIGISAQAATGAGAAIGGTYLRTGSDSDAHAAAVSFQGDGGILSGNGSLSATANAGAQSDNVAVGIAYTSVGGTLGGSLADSGADADATALGVDAGNGGKYHECLAMPAISRCVSIDIGDLAVDAVSQAESFGGSLNVGIATTGGAIGVAAVLADTDSNATAIGVSSLDGDDSIDLRGALNVDADAHSGLVQIGIGVEYTSAGVALGGSLVDASTASRAQAVGVQSGSGDDRIAIWGDANIHAQASHVTVGGAANLAIAASGVSGGGAMVSGGADMDAIAWLANGGDGKDIVQLLSGDPVQVEAKAGGTLTSVSLGMAGTAAGVTIAAGILDTVHTADAIAGGIDGGASDDYLLNRRALGVDALADPNSVGVNVDISFASAGVAGAASLVRARTQGNATAVGMAGGIGADTILNHGRIDATATSDADGFALSLALPVSLAGGTLAASLADTSVVSHALATGIGGDAARIADRPFAIDPDDGGDFITTSEAVTATANAKSQAQTIAVSLPVSFVPLGGTMVDASSDAITQAFGVDAGGGDDFAWLSGDVFAVSEADASGVTVGVTAVGLAFGDLGIEASSTATGFDGGLGNDRMSATKLLRAAATSLASGVNVQFALGGATVAQSDVDAIAAAIGARGGGGDDLLFAELVDVDAIADTSSIQVAINGAGATVTETGTIVEPTAIGLAGDDGADTLWLRHGTVDATASAFGLDIAYTGSGANLGDSLFEATSGAIGLDGGAGGDRISLVGSLDVRSMTDITSIAVRPALFGAGIAQVTIDSLASAIGVSGGHGSDIVTLGADSSLGILADNDSFGLTVDVQMAGYQNPTSTLLLEAVAKGAALGAGDDNLLSDGTVVVRADADGSGIGIGVQLAGASAANVDTQIDSEAYGFELGDGDDAAFVSGTSTISAHSDFDGFTLNIAGLGAGFNQIESIANSRASILRGGSGNDLFVIAGIHLATASSALDIDNLVLNAAGLASSNVDLTARATSIGIDGGTGSDVLDLIGSVAAVSSATLDLRTIGIGAFGSVQQQSVGKADAKSTGVDLGAGNDFARISGSVEANSDSLIESSNLSINLAGAVGSDADMSMESDSLAVALGDGDDVLVTTPTANLSALADTNQTASRLSIQLAGAIGNEPAFGHELQATVIEAGSGNDILSLDGILFAKAELDFHTSSSSFQLAGLTSEAGKVQSKAFAAGVDLGGGDDQLDLKTALAVQAISEVSSSSGSFNLFGALQSSPRLGGDAEAIGILGGSGNDTVKAASLTVTSFADTATSGGSVQIIGSSTSNSSTGALSSATGMNLGTGNDTLLWVGGGLVRANSHIDISGGSFGVIGSGDQRSAGEASSIATGADGGGDDDTLALTGSVEVRSYAEADLRGSVRVFIGATNDQSATRANATSFGLSGGSGNDVVANLGSLSVYARTNVDANRSTISNIGSTVSNGAGRGNATAYGLSGSSGNDDLINNGSLLVEAYNDVDVSGAQSSIFAGSTGTQTASAVATARGFHAISGNNRAFLGGTTSVYANNDVDSHISANTAAFFDDTSITASTWLRGTASGVNFGSGNDVVIVEGSVFAQVHGRSDASAEIDGEFFAIDSNVHTVATARNDRQFAGGILTSSGDNAVFIAETGSVTARVDGVADGWSKADGDGISGRGRANADGFARDTTAIGVDASHSLVLENLGSIVAIAAPRSEAWSWSDSDGANVVGEDTFADADAYSYNAEAYGVRGGSEADTIVNKGSIVADSRPVADAESRANTFFADATNLDAFSNATALAEDTLAIGIYGRGGNDTIFNEGSIFASIDPYARSHAYAEGSGEDGDATATTTAKAGGIAYGIAGGSGDDTIVNNGLIEVEADADASATRTRLTGGTINEGEAGGTVTRVESNTSIGISGGSGDDWIINRGTIRNLGQGTKTAISAGSGNDIVALVDGSATPARILLESGDDTLYLSGVSTRGTVSGGSGTDSIIVHEAGSSIGGAISSFEELTKTGAGHFYINLLSGVREVTIAEGTLRLGSSYSMPSNASFDTLIDGDGSHGQLRVDGSASLRGTLKVFAGNTPFSNGQRFDIISASTVSNDFSSVNLPEPTAMLSFSTQKLPTRYDIIANVASLTGFASPNAMDQAFAEQLDLATSTSSGLLEAIIADWQQAPEGYDFASDIAALNPANVGMMIAPAATASQLFVDAIDARLATLAFDGQPAAAQRIGLANFRSAQSQATGSWLLLHGQDYSPGSHAVGSDIRLSPGHHIGFAHARVHRVGVDGGIRGNRLGTEAAVYGQHSLTSSAFLNWKLGAGSSELPGAIDFAWKGLARERHRFAQVGLGQQRKAMGGQLTTSLSLRYDDYDGQAIEGRSSGLDYYHIDAQEFAGLSARIGAHQRWSLRVGTMPVEAGIGFDYRHRFDLRGGTMIAHLEGGARPFELPIFETGADALSARMGIEAQLTRNIRLGAQIERDLLDQFTQSDRARVALNIDF